MNECPDNFVGTSNVWMSNEIGMQPIGTFAHELPMIYAGIADAIGLDIADSHSRMLDVWQETFGDDLSTALTDTFTSEFFFESFTKEQAEQYKALRHDSGDPFEFTDRVIEFYKGNDIDPQSKTIVFSDGLDLDTIIALQDHCKDKINAVYGWGTNLMNDMGPAVKPLNIVMKATRVDLPTGESAELVKLSDDEGKHTGPPEQIKKYQEIVRLALEKEIEYA